MNNIESRVLEMKFDNEQFESAVATTMNTLDKFKEKLKFDDASKNIHKLGQATTNYQYSLQDVGTSLSNLERYFASCGTIGAKIFDTLTTKAANFVTNSLGNLVSGVTQGGLSRAMNLEQAKFQMQGIYKNAQKVYDIIYDAILPELQGTPYSLDQAAVVIGQLGASGVQSAEDVRQATRAIAGLAAMSGRGFDEVGRVFSKVAGQGNMMGGELQQLSTYGINAAANLSEYFTKVYKGQVEATDAVKKHVAEVAKDFGLNEAAIRDAASKRKIYYEDMASAMDYLYGAHAKKSTEMYTGALEDLKAALARVGAEPAAVGLNVLRDAFNALVPAVDAVNAVLKPFTNATKGIVKVNKEKVFGGEMYGSLAKQVQKLGVSFANLFVEMDINGKITRWSDKSIKKYKKSLKELEKAGGEVLDWQKKYAAYASKEDAVMNPHMWRTITAATKSFVNVFAAFGKIIGAVGKGLRKALPKVTFDQIASLAEKIEAFTEKLIPTQKGLWLIKNAAQAAFTPFGLLLRTASTAVKLFGRAISFITPILKPIFNSFEVLIDDFNIFIIRLGVAAGHVGKAISNFARFGSTILTTIARVLKFNKVVNLIQGGFGKLFSSIGNFFLKAGNKAIVWARKLEKFSENLKLDETTAKVEGITAAIADFFNVAFHFDEISAGFKEFWEPIKEFLDSHSLFDTIINCFKELVDWIGQLIGKDTLVDRITTALDNLRDSISGFTAKPSGKIRKWLGDTGKAVAEFLKNMDDAGYVSEWLRSNFKPLELLYQLGKPIKQIIQPLGTSILEFTKSFTGIGSTAELVSDAGNLLKSGFEKIVAAVSIIFSSDTDKKFKTVSETLFNSSLAENAKQVGTNLNTAIKPFTEAIGKLGDSISKYFGNVDPQTVKKILVSLVLLLVAISYMETLSNARRTIRGFLIILDRFAAIPVAMLKTIEAFEDVAVAFKAIAKAIRGVAFIMAISASLVIFAAALKILSTIDTGALLNGTFILGIAIAGIIGLFHYLDKLDMDAFGNKVFKLAMAMLGVGGSMMLMSLAIKTLTDTIDTSGWKNVAFAVGAIVVLMAAIAGFAALLAKKDISSDIKTLGWAAVGLGQGMKMMAEACKMLSTEMDPDELDRGIAAISQLMIMFAVFAAANWHGNATGKAAFAMMGIAVAMALVARTLKYIAKNLEKSDMAAAANIVSEIVVFFGLFAIAMGIAAKLGASSMMATAMVLSMALFIKVLGESMVLMSSLVAGGELDKIAEVIQAFLAIMAVISLISAVGGVNAAAGPAAIAAVGVALLGLAGAIYILASMDVGMVAVGFIRLGAALLGLIGVVVGASLAFKAFVELLDKEDALVVLSIAAAILFFSEAIKMLASLPVDSLKVAIGGLIGIMAAAGIVMLAFSGAGAGLLVVGAAFALVGTAALFVGVGLMLVTLALSALIPLIVSLGKTSETDLAAGLNILLLASQGLKEVFYNIADGVMLFGLAILEAGLGLVIFGVGLAAVGVGVVILSVAILGLAGSFAVLASVLDAFVPQIKDSVLGTLGTLIGKVGDFFANLRKEKDAMEEEINQGVESTSANIDKETDVATKKIGESGTTINDSLVGLWQQNGVNEAAGESGGLGAMSWLTSAGDTLTSEGPGILGGSLNGMIDTSSFAGIKDQFTSNFGELPGLAGSAMQSNASAAKPGGEAIVESAAEGANSEAANKSFEDAAIKSAEKWASALKKSTKPKTNAESMSKSAASATTSGETGAKWKSAGEDAAKGFASGISSGTPKWVTSAARDMAKAAVRAAKAELDEHSPSRVFMQIGRYVGEGFVMGIDAMASNVEKTTADLMDTSVGAARIAAAAINAATDIDDFTPTITPVVDLSNVDQSVTKMGTMFDAAFGVTAPYGAMNAAYAAQSFADSRNQNARIDSINRLASKLDTMTETMNSRSLNNYINIDGSADPEAFADGLIRSFRLNARTV